MATTDQQQRWAAEGRPAPKDRLARKKPMERRVPVPLDPQLVEELNDAMAELEGARMAKVAQAELDRLADRAAVARAAVEAETVTLTFRAVGRRAWDALLEEHPPTEEQDKEHRAEYKGARAPYNGDTFPPAAIHASLVAGGHDDISIEDVVGWCDDWNMTEIMELFAAALEVNTQRRVASLGNV